MKEFKRTKHNPTIGMTDEEVTQYWIEKSIEKYGDSFDYRLVETISIKKDPCKIICKEHGVLETSFYNHLSSGTGCPHCGEKSCRKSKTFNLDIFNKKLDEKYPNRDWKVLGDYIHNTKHIIVEDRFGLLHKMKPNVMLNRSSTPCIKTAINKEEYCIRRFNEVHDFKYDYPNFTYCGAKCKIDVSCKKHGLFKRTPNDHNNGVGCPICANELVGDIRRSNTKDFIDKCVIRFNHSIKIYDKVDYRGAKKEILIFCEKCEDYYKTIPNSHYSGYGCPKCNKGGYSRTDYINQAKGRDGSLYLLKCSKQDEVFYKIGITFQGIKNRFSGSSSIPYDYEIINEYICDVGCTWDLEKKLHKKYKPFQYFPKESFAGYTECFTTELPIEEIISYLKSL